MRCAPPPPNSPHRSPKFILVHCAWSCKLYFPYWALFVFSFPPLGVVRRGDRKEGAVSGELRGGGAVKFTM